MSEYNSCVLPQQVFSISKEMNAQLQNEEDSQTPERYKYRDLPYENHQFQFTSPSALLWFHYEVVSSNQWCLLAENSDKMFVKLTTCVFLLIVCAESSLGLFDFDSVGQRIIYKVYDECIRSDTGITPCLKKKAITFIDRVAKLDAIPLIDGVSVLKTGDAKVTPIQTEMELENSLPRGLEARDQMLNSLLIDRVAAFFGSHTLKLQFPDMTSQELSRSIEEGKY